MSNDWLSSLYGHQEWADAEHWRAIGTLPAARDNEAVLNRLHHIHFVQHAFLWTVGDRQKKFVPTKVDEFEQVWIVWFTDPPLTLTVAEALTQCAMHSHYHRGQNATLLRELGGVPPTTDLIFWQWKGRPAGTW